MDRPPTFSIDAVARSWTERATPPWRRWAIVAIVSVGLHFGPAGWLWLREPAAVGSASGAPTSARVPSTAARSMVVTVIARSNRAVPPARDDTVPRARAITRSPPPAARPPMNARSSRDGAPAPSAPALRAVSAGTAGIRVPTAPTSGGPGGLDATGPSAPTAPRVSAASTPSSAVTASTRPLDLSLTATPFGQRSAAPTQRAPWFDDLRRPATPSDPSARAERRTNDGVQLRRGEDCVEVRPSRQSALDPFSATDRPAARGVQPCE